MITGKTLWGSDRPIIILLRQGGQRVRKKDRLPGKFSFTSGSKIVSTTEDMRSILESGVTLSYSRNAPDDNYVVNTIDSTTQVTLTENANDTKTSVNGYTDISVITMPFTKMTMFSFTPVRRDNGPMTIQLNNGLIVNRIDGFRVRVVFTWDLLERYEFTKLCRVISHQVKGKIQVQPHKDVKMKFEMVADAGFNPTFPGDKLVATNISIGFTSVDLIPSIPTIHSGFVGRPLGF